MDDMRAILQDELRQAFAGLLPPPATAPAPTTVILSAAIISAAVVPTPANPLIMDAPPANNNNDGGQPLNAARNVPTVKMKFEDVENYMVEKAKKESLEQVQKQVSHPYPHYRYICIHITFVFTNILIEFKNKLVFVAK